MWFSLDPSNKVVEVSPDWDDAARDRGGAAMLRQGVVGRSLWDFVNGSETRSYLNALFFWSRQTGRTLVLPYRCDAPGLRRDCQMMISAADAGGLEVRHELLGVAEVPGHHLLPPGSAARQCSQCLNWDSPDGWYDRTLSVPARDLFVHYVICPSCRQAANRAVGG
ncbi:hypothetical protein [Marinovum sp.]|uniref:hypothetical protein n=1 Tax=Marinovum sp. TaxID=2024839 RepID=UPI002B2789E3|nr:hypothetical protein [Marinovum sp.]